MVVMVMVMKITVMMMASKKSPLCELENLVISHKF